MRCKRCGDTLGARGACPRCGRAGHPNASAPSLLAELRPEAEPPLPAAHEMLRGRTPALGSPRRDPTPAPARAVIATVVETSLPTAPGPIVDPSAWFEQSALRAGDAPRRPGSAAALREWNAISTPTGPLLTPTPQRLPGPEAAEASIRAAALRELTRDHATARGHRVPLELAPASIEEPAQSSTETPLVEVRPLRRAAVAVICCLTVGVLVGWLLS